MKERYSHELPPWMRALGIWRINKDSIDYWWGLRRHQANERRIMDGYFSPRWGLGFEFGYTYENSVPCITIAPGWGHFMFTIPFCKGGGFDFDKFDSCAYGFSWKYEASNIMFYWRDKCRVWDVPFIAKCHDKEFHAVEDASGAWVQYRGSYRLGEKHHYESASDVARIEQINFVCVLNNGTKQERIASCYRERRRWWPKWGKWLPKRFWLTRYSMWADFSDEVGEQTGTWKGGVTGTGIELLTPDEPLKDALDRLLKDRDF